jgi:hypothetical protein
MVPHIPLIAIELKEFLKKRTIGTYGTKDIIHFYVSGIPAVPALQLYWNRTPPMP